LKTNHLATLISDKKATPPFKLSAKVTKQGKETFLQFRVAASDQGCQIFHGTTYQKGVKYTK
jgi:hypothetical protein